MAAQNLVVLTRTDNGKEFKVSTNKIIEFKTIASTKSLVTYIDQRGQVDHKKCDQSVATINAATGSRTQAVTLYPSAQVIYINSDRIIYLDLATFGTIITYDISGNRGKYNHPPVTFKVTETAANISTAAGNTGIIYPTAGKVRYINGDFIDLVVHDVKNTVDYEVLYDDKKTEFTKLHLDSANTSFSINSGW